MREFNFRFPRLWVTACLSLLLIGVALSIALFSAQRSLAQVGAPQRAPAVAQPYPPPPLSPPAQGPALNWGPRQSVDQASLHSVLEADEFQPQMRIQLADTPQLQAAPKVAGGERTDAPRPAPERARPSDGLQSPNQADELQAAGWNWIAYEGFEGAFPAYPWTLYDYGPDGYDRTWGDTYNAYYGCCWSAWPAAGGLDGLDPATVYYYTDNLYSWMVWGPFDLSTAADVYVDFGLWLDTEPDYDWFYFGASVDNFNYDVYYWSGYNGGWTYEPFWMTSYAGYSQVWFAWIFYSDSSISNYYGPYVDEINLWTYEAPALDPSGDLVIDGSFENGGEGWRYASFAPTTSQIAEAALAERVTGGGAAPLQPMQPTAPTDVYLTDLTAVDGVWSALMLADADWNDFLFQPITVPVGTTDIQFDFWFAVTTDELQPDTDWFCASLSDTSFNIIVDLGCQDASFTTGYWQEVIYTLDDQQVSDAVAAGTVNLVFELYNRGSTGTDTAAWIDYVRFYATGGGGGGYVDPNEPNDDTASATLIGCGDTRSGVIGDALVGYGDVDWFRLYNVPVGRLDLDIDAQTLVPASALDSVVYVYDDSLSTLLAYNDDDGATYDSYAVYTNSVPNATLYAAVVSYSGYGGPDSFYNLSVYCADSGGGPPPPPDTTEGANNTWTVMLYLNAEDPGFEPILLQYIDDMEAVLAGKTDFLKVAVLYDGPDSGDTVRYLLQASEVYTDGVNRWALGELNVGHPDTLSNFVSWAMDQYPAENYYLAIDDHGDGAYGISWDRNASNDQLTPPELYSALKSATHNGARKIDLFDYEACLMGLAENAYDLREWVDYVVFFEQISWGLDTYPQYFSDLAATDAPLTVGQRIIDRYYTGASNAGYPHTISLIDTSQMAAVSAAIDNFGNAIMAVDTQTRKDNINAARDGSQAFAADLDATDPFRAEYIDLWDLANEANNRNLVPTQAAAVRAAVDAAVVHERHASGGVDGYIWEHGGAHGLSIYFPPSKSSSAFNSYVAETLYQMSQQGDWDEFLNWAVPSGARRGMSTHRSEIKLDGGDTFIYRYVYLPMLTK